MLLGGKIVEERLIRGRADVTVGQSSKNTFSVPLEGLPREWTLFKSHEGTYSLDFTGQMDGRLSDGDKVQTLAVAREGGARRIGDHFSLPLGDHARGKVSIGDLTLLFQFVTEPPLQPRPLLPHSVRGTLADRIDPRLAVIVAASVALHFGFMIAAMQWDPPGSGGIAYRAAKQTFAEDSVPVSFDQPLAIPEQGDEGKAEDKPAEKEPDKGPDKKPAGDKKPTSDKPADSGGGRDKNDAVALQEQAGAAADALFSDDETGSGVAGAMASRAPGSDLGKQLDEVAKSGATTSIGGTGGRSTRGTGDPRVGTGTGPGVTGPGGPVSATGPDGKTGEKVPTGRITATDKKTFDDSTLTPDAVLRKILSAYMAGLKRCHKELLKTDPTARGKIKLSFTVNESGRTVSPKANGFADSLDSCIQGQMGNWRFDIPKDGDGEPTDASFEIALQLVPE
ncbi:MAG: AgmX/PglI C-terminal domain-containing protein [Myxococcales bacterium]|nr:AgmX/PglI C-terminal domain-containing protein [Myxococcales bacterium]